ncbi:MAG: emp24/gp25L/p24 family protein, partial [Prevotella sp.]|nr:emp24/gp25L/p24 family protein [Prevotella sp.]
VMRSIDRELAFILENPGYALTPKEAFFCLMERNGKTDADKARAFCCSEQALRSTKSRLAKKFDLQMLHA